MDGYPPLGLLAYDAIYQLYLNDPIVHAVVTVQQRDRLTDEETLLMLVEALAKAKQEMQNQLIETLSLMPPRSFILPTTTAANRDG